MIHADMELDVRELGDDQLGDFKYNGFTRSRI